MGPGPTAGFCPPGAVPWLPVNADRSTANVADQDGDPDSMLSLYRMLFRVRREHPALHSGRLDLVPGAPRDTIAWLRSHDGEQVLFAANLGDTPAEVPLGAPAVDLLVVTARGVALSSASPSDAATVRLPAHSAAVVQLATPAGAAPARPGT